MHIGDGYLLSKFESVQNLISFAIGTNRENTANSLGRSIFRD